MAEQMQGITPEPTGWIDLEQMFGSKNCAYVLRVRGDSMVDDHLVDGDFIVVERRDNAKNGEQVIALLDTGEATLRRYYREGDKVRLEPRNPKFQARIVDADKCKVVGVIIGVIRSY